MFSKEERKAYHAKFWTRLKEQAGVNKGANGKRINWVNYPTHLKQVYVRLHADAQKARISIEIQDKDEGIRDLIWEQFIELKKVLENEMPSPGVWEKEAYNTANQSISRISWTLKEVNMYERSDWQKIFNFFIPHLVGFDRFYSTYDEILKGLLK